jgi:hypothetical protein
MRMSLGVGSCGACADSDVALASCRTGCFARRMRARLLVLLLALTGVVGMALAVQLVDQGSFEPSGKLFLDRVGFSTQLWVEVPLFLAGLTSVLVAAATQSWVARNRRRDER